MGPFHQKYPITEQYSSTLEFLMAVRPEKAVISCGEGTPTAIPDFEVLLRLAAFGVDVYRTDLHGTITVLIDDGTVDILTHKRAVKLQAP